MIKSKSLPIVLLLAVIFALAGCQQGGAFVAPAPAAPAAPAAAATAAPAAAAADLYHFCIVHNNADHPSITAIVRGMQDEAPNFGAKLTFFDPAFDPQKQLSQIDDCIALKPDAILVNAVDPAAVVPG